MEQFDEQQISEQDLRDMEQVDESPVVDIFNSAGNTQLSEDSEAADIDENDVSGDADSSTGSLPKGKVTLGKVISGKATVKIVNIFIPAFIVFAMNRFGYKTEKKHFRLTLEEENILAPVIQDCLDYTIVNFSNPYYALAFVSTMIYGSKIMDAIPEIKKVAEVATNEVIEEQEEPANENVSPELEAVRNKLDSTTIRAERNRILYEVFERYAPIDKIEMWKVYNGIYPEKEERSFYDWYERNYEKLPQSLKFGKDEPKPSSESFTL